jgi:hypothetical protein
MSGTLSAEAPVHESAREEHEHEDEHVKVFRYDGVTYVVDSEGAQALHCAERSRMLKDMPEAQGYTKLPLSLDALHLWITSVADMESIWPSPEWQLHTRARDLCTLATVRFCMSLFHPPRYMLSVSLKSAKFQKHLSRRHLYS